MCRVASLFYVMENKEKEKEKEETYQRLVKNEFGNLKCQLDKLNSLPGPPDPRPKPYLLEMLAKNVYAQDNIRQITR